MLLFEKIQIDASIYKELYRVMYQITFQNGSSLSFTFFEIFEVTINRIHCIDIYRKFVRQLFTIIHGGFTANR